MLRSEMISSLLQSFLAANIAGAVKHQVGDYPLLRACSDVASLISLGINVFILYTPQRTQCTTTMMMTLGYISLIPALG